MKTYKITTQSATFGIGILLQLTEEQAVVRKHALICKGENTFEVKEPVQFKQGEVVNVVKGTLSRFLEDRLKAIKTETVTSTPDESQNQDQKDIADLEEDEEDEEDKETEEEEDDAGNEEETEDAENDKAEDSNNSTNSQEFPRMEHIRFGLYNVYDSNGKLATPKPIKKEEAQLLLEEFLNPKEEAGDGI